MLNLALAVVVAAHAIGHVLFLAPAVIVAVVWAHWPASSAATHS